MKSLKKTLVLLVVFSMILSAVMPAFAATDVAGLDCEEEVARLEALKIVSGYEDGTYAPEKTITRAEMAVILCKMVGIDSVTVDENKYVPSKFSDVAVGEWYTGHINVAAGKGLLSGFPDGTFRPSENLTMNQVLTLCVNALGRGEYVAEMGTWPANYIAEATKLGLLDGVKTSDANRGNVAIIAWNTLEAPYVWDVNSTEFEGTINLSNSKRSLLSIYFRDFATDAGELKEIAEIEGFEIDERQLKIDAADVEFAAEFEKEPKKGLKEKSYKVLADGEDAQGNPVKYVDYVRVYVPEEVYEDLDELEDKEITVILGKDDVAVAIIIEDEIAEKDFLTAYDSNKEKITVGGTKYDLATDPAYVLELNGNEDAWTVATALEALGVAEEDFDDIEKKIKAEIKLNDDEEVARIELTASAFIPTISDEVLVTKVKETNSKYTITTTEGKITWDIEEENDDEVEFPKVYVDGVKADIRDIVPGMVISIFGRDLQSDLELDDTKALASLKIHAVTNGTVEGAASRIKKANLAITMDGTVYTASSDAVTMSTEELAKYAGTTINASNLNDVVDNDTITMYLNMFGEYAFITLDEVASNWTFGVVTYVSSNITWEGEDEEVAVRNIKLLLKDGSKKTFKLKVDTSDSDEISVDIQNLVVTNDKDTDPNSEVDALVVGDFVAVDADADRVIEIEKGDEIIIIAAVDTDSDAAADDVALTKLTGAEATSVGDYAVRFVQTATTDKDDQEFDNYEYTSNTVIFNTLEKEIVTKWKAILAASGTEFADDANTIAIFEDDEEEEALYMVVALDSYGQEDAIYAVVEESENVGDENYVKFVGQEEMEADDEVGLLEEGWMVAYKTASSKVSSVQKLINIDAIAKATSIDTKTVYEYLFATCTIATVGDCATHTAAQAVTPSAEEQEAGKLACGCTIESTTTWAVTTPDGGCTAAEGNVSHTAADVVTPSATEQEAGKLACNCAIASTTTWAVVTPYECPADHAEDDVVASSELDCGCTVAVEDIFFTLGSGTLTETRFVGNNGTADVITDETTMEQIVLDEVEIKTSGKITLKYEKTDVAAEDTAIGSVKLDKDAVKVYDLRDGDVKEIDIEDLATEVNDEDEDVYVIPAGNAEFDYTEGANVVFIVR